MTEEVLAAGVTQLPNWLQTRANLSPARLALIAGDVRWTFADLNRQVVLAAARLAGDGVQEGDRVATLLRNGPAPVVLLHALVRLGAVLVPLNVRLTPLELAWQLDNSGARFLYFDDEQASKATAASERLPELKAVAVESLPQGAVEPPEGAAVTTRARLIDLRALHSIVYTSGTTGRPKGAMLTYGNHWWNAMGSALNLGLHADDRLLASLPLFHVGGMAILLRSVLYGCTAVVHERFDPEAMNAAIDADGITIISVVTAMLRRMLEVRRDRPYPPWLRCVLLGGGPAPLPLLEDCAARGIPVVQTYGLTETGSQAVTLAPEDALRKLGSAGKPLFPVELRIAGDGRDSAPGETGEILLRGPSVSPGYYRDPHAETARPGGWLFTGDLGWLDGDGYLYVVDRRDDLIISGGENIYPAEVEAVLLAHPAVAEAGVTGAPDPQWGQVPVAAVVLRPDTPVTEADLLTFCAERLARYKIPAHLDIRSALPRTASGKLQRRLLRER